MVQLNYNERSWAIDVIAEIKKYLANKSVIIKNAGGENTLKKSKSTYFPDVLLFGDELGNSILQGWELKMPDTPITDPELIKNAREKADLLGVNSFLLWNVSEAVLYKIDDEGNHKIIKTWNDLNYINTREIVRERTVEWKQTLHKILDDLVDYFNRGEIRSTTIIDSVTGEGISNFILENVYLVADCLKQYSATNVDFEDEVFIWWDTVKVEYPNENEPWQPLAKNILISWMNKLLFAHIMKNFREEATIIDKIDLDTKPAEAVNIITDISSKCDFWNIFAPQLGEEHIPSSVWEKIVHYNIFLTDLKLESVGQDLIQEILQSTIYRTHRKLAGQFTTPKKLADLLVVLTIKNKRGNVYDPCCGTGSIARAAFDLKVESGISYKEALQTTWASDKFSFPLQMATLALTNPKNIGEVINIFKKDISDLKAKEDIKLSNPVDGSEIIKQLPQMSSIVSNLPFVRQEVIKKLNPSISKNINNKIKKALGKGYQLKAKSDLYAYLPFVLWDLLEDDGRLGIIISNSWLSTEWGVEFKKALKKFFHIEAIVTSGKGKWFNNADVVTNILILNKINPKADSLEGKEISFVTLTEDIINKEYNDKNLINNIARSIRTKKKDKYLNIETYSLEQIEKIDELGITWSALFSNCDWLFEITDKLLPASKIFDIARGERRGWNALFYPEPGHGIEKIYLKPVLKSSRDIKGYTATANSEAFCCTVSLQKLREMGHLGAYNWIKKFENGVNNTGQPLVEVLTNPQYSYWYSLEPKTLADFVISMNPDERLFVAKLETRSFVDQRLIRFTANVQDVDMDLVHALMNSILGLFFIEALGFGRGLGALDLNATKFKRDLKILNPYLVSKEQAERIKDKFSKLKKRGTLPLLEDLNCGIRKEFDDVVLRAFGIEKYKEQMERSLKNLYNIRKSVCQNN